MAGNPLATIAQSLASTAPQPGLFDGQLQMPGQQQLPADAVLAAPDLQAPR